MLSKLAMKIAISLLIGVIAVLIRKIITSLNRRSSDSIIRQIKKDPSFARKIASTLDTPFGEHTNFTAYEFEAFTRYLFNVLRVGILSYSLLRCVRQRKGIGEDRIIIHRI
jgi:hypothetical protein